MKIIDKIRKLWFNTSAKRILSLCNYTVIYNKLEQNAFFCKETGVDEASEIIVSLTTYGKFINNVHITIESLLEQTVKPKKIILWISDAYEDYEIPQILKNLCKRGLEIRKTKDIRSYKKLIPCLKEYPNNPIITCDDDIIYPIDTIEWLYKAYKNDSTKIYFRRGHKMKLESENNFVPYNNFDWEIQDNKIDIFNFPTGVGGVLYPQNCFSDEVFNEEKFMSLAPFADDVWFKAMALLKGTLSQKVWTENPCYIELDMLHENTKERLSGKNVKQSKNDGQIKAVWDEYNLWEKMR